MRNVSFLLVFSLFIMLSVSVTAASAERYPNTVTAAREAAWKVITSGGGSAVTVAVMDDGKIIYSEGFGAAVRADNRPVDKDTRFNIGSTSKMFAAVAVLLLVDEGKIGLDDPVAKYIPEFVMKDKRYKDITVRMLFNHSSGLPGSTFIFEYKAESNPHEMLLTTLKDVSLKHAPGAMAIYCNDGFTLAEIIVERVSGKKFVSFLSERVFSPLGMMNTKASVGEVPGNIAEFYDVKSGKKEPLEIVPVYGAGGLSSTPEDLCRFADSLSPGGKNILSHSSLNELLKSQPTLFSLRLRGHAVMDSFGWDYSSLPSYSKNGLQVLAKGGGTGFYSTGLQVIPSKRIAVAVSISGKLNGESVSRPILDALMKDKGLPVPENEQVNRPLDPQPIPSDMLAFDGFYTNSKGFFRFVFNRDKQTLEIYPVAVEQNKDNIGMPTLTFIYNDGSFHNNERDLHCYFIRDKGTAYFVEEKIPLYDADNVIFQSIDEIKNPVKLSADIGGKLWLLRNTSPFIQACDGLLMCRSYTFKNLPGYLTFFNVMEVENPEYSSITATSFRDQTDMKFFRKDGELRAKSAQFIFSEESCAGTLTVGKNKVTIGADGDNEWLKVDKGMIISFIKPENGRIMLFTEEEENPVLYDSTVDRDKIYAPQGSYIFLAGYQGEEFIITAE